MLLTSAFDRRGLLLGMAGARVAPGGIPDIPVGFDAVAQFGPRLLRRSFADAIGAARLARIAIRRVYDPDLLPDGLREAAAEWFGVDELGAASLENRMIEFRLFSPRLRTLGTHEPDIVVTDGRVGEPMGDRPAQIVWDAAFAVVKEELVLSDARLSGRGPTSGSPTNPDSADPVLDYGGSGSDREKILGRGVVVTEAATRLDSRVDLLHVWLSFDLATLSTRIETGDSLMRKLAEAPLGNDFLDGVDTRIGALADLKACPRLALGGALSAAQVAALDLGPGAADYRIHRGVNGTEILSIGVNFGADTGGLIDRVGSFLANQDFAYFAASSLFGPVLRQRWRQNGTGRFIQDEIRIRMPLYEGSSETGMGTASIRARLATELDDVALMAAEDASGDVLRLAFNQRIQVLELRWPNGDPVGNLGELGEPATIPISVNVSPFADAEADVALESPIRLLLLDVLEPLAVPLENPYLLARLEGFLSEALNASICRWSLPAQAGAREVERTDAGGSLNG